jgi:hypothetical protein
VRLERIEQQAARDQEADDLKFVRLSGSLSRSLRALAALKPRPAAEGCHAASSLDAHLAAMAAKKRQALEAGPALVINDGS